MEEANDDEAGNDGPDGFKYFRISVQDPGLSSVDGFFRYCHGLDIMISYSVAESPAALGRRG